MGKVKEHMYGEDDNEQVLHIGLSIGGSAVYVNGEPVTKDHPLMEHIRMTTVRDYEIAMSVLRYEKANKKQLNDEELRTLINKFDD